MKLSIITVCKNASAGIAQTIDSVLTQTYSDYEYIVMDGGSVDDTADIVKSYQKGISRFVSEADRGVWHAMNKGISLAEGEYIYFLNAGDRLYDKETLKNVLNDDSLNEGIVYGDIIENHGNRYVQMNYPDTISIRYLFSNMICHQATFVKKALFEKYGYFDERYKFVADYDFLWRCIIKYQASYRHIARPIAYYDMNGLTTNPENRDELAREWLAVQDHYLSVSRYFYVRFLRPFLVQLRNILLRNSAD